jgi:hypothetical protein
MQFLLCCLLLLIRVLLYSSPCWALRHPLWSRRPPASVTTFPLPSLLQCPDASHREMLRLMFASTVFASRCQPLAERSCRVRFRVDPDAPRHRCCCCSCSHLHVVIVVGIAVVLVTATLTIAELALPVDSSCHHFPPRQQVHLCLLSFMLIVA